MEQTNLYVGSNGINYGLGFIGTINGIKRIKQLYIGNENNIPVKIDSGQNLFTGLFTGHANHPNYDATLKKWTGAVVKIKPNTTYTVKRESYTNRFQIMTGRLDNGIYAPMTEVNQTIGDYNNNDVNVTLSVTTGIDDDYLVVYLSNEGHFKDILLKVEVGETHTPYTPAPENIIL